MTSESTAPITTLVVVDSDAGYVSLGTTVTLMAESGMLERGVIDVATPTGLLVAAAFSGTGTPFEVFNAPSDIGRNQDVHNLLGEAEKIRTEFDLDDLVDEAEAVLLVPGLTTIEQVEGDETSAKMNLDVDTPTARAMQRAIEQGRSGMRVVLPAELGLSQIDAGQSDEGVYVRRIHMFSPLDQVTRMEASEIADEQPSED